MSTQGGLSLEQLGALLEGRRSELMGRNLYGPAEHDEYTKLKELLDWNKFTEQRDMARRTGVPGIEQPQGAGFEPDAETSAAPTFGSSLLRGWGRGSNELSTGATNAMAALVDPSMPQLPRDIIRAHMPVWARVGVDVLSQNDVASSGLRQEADRQAAVANAAYPAPAEDAPWHHRAGDTVGTFAPALAASAAFPPAAPAVFGIPATGRGYDEALESGASREQALARGGLYGAANAIAAAPLSVAGGLLPKAMAKAPGLLPSAGRALLGGTEAGLVNATQVTAENVAAQHTGDPNRPTFQGTPQAFGAGFVLGTGGHAIGEAGRVSQSAKDKAQEAQVKERQRAILQRAMEEAQARAAMEAQAAQRQAQPTETAPAQNENIVQEHPIPPEEIETGDQAEAQSMVDEARAQERLAAVAENPAQPAPDAAAWVNLRAALNDPALPPDVRAAVEERLAQVAENLFLPESAPPQAPPPDPRTTPQITGAMNHARAMARKGAAGPAEPVDVPVRPEPVQPPLDAPLEVPFSRERALAEEPPVGSDVARSKVSEIVEDRRVKAGVEEEFGPGYWRKPAPTADITPTVRDVMRQQREAQPVQEPEVPVVEKTMDAPDLAAKTVEAEPPVPPGQKRLYRAEPGKGDGPVPDWAKDDPAVKASSEASGRWFYGTRAEAEAFAKDFDGSGEITYVDVPADQAARLTARNDPDAVKHTGGRGAGTRADEEFFVPKEVAAARKPLTPNEKPAWTTGTAPTHTATDALPAGDTPVPARSVLTETTGKDTSPAEPPVIGAKDARAPTLPPEVRADAAPKAMADPPEPGWLKALREQAEAAERRLKAPDMPGMSRLRNQRGNARVIRDMADWATIGAYRIAKLGNDVSVMSQAWKDAMLEKFGERIRPHLAAVWKQAVEKHAALFPGEAKTEPQKSQEAPKVPAVETSVAQAEQPATEVKPSVVMKDGQPFTIHHGPRAKPAIYRGFKNGKHYYEYKGSDMVMKAESRGDAAFVNAVRGSAARPAFPEPTADPQVIIDAGKGDTPVPPPAPPRDPNGPRKKYQADDPGVDQALREARGIPRRSWVREVRESLSQWVRSHWRHFGKLPASEHPDAQDALRVMESLPAWATQKAVRQVEDILHGLDAEQAYLFGNILVARDVVQSIKNGMYRGDKEVPFFKTAEAAQAQLAKWEATAAEDPRVQAALAARSVLAKQVVADRVAAGLAKPDDVQNPENYFHRQVLDYQNLRNKIGIFPFMKSARIKEFGFQKERVGTSDPHNVNYAEAEIEWLAQHYDQMARRQEFERVRNSGLDIYPQLEAEHGRDWRKHIPAGYKAWTLSKVDAAMQENGQFAAVIQTLLDKGAGEGLTKSERFILDVLTGSQEPPLVVPERWAETLDNMHQQSVPVSFIDKAKLWVNRAWKISKLFLPWNVPGYSARNFMGDSDAALAFSHRIGAGVPRAFADLFMYRSGKASPELVKDIEEMMRYDVIGSHFTATEIPDVSELFRKFEENPKYYGVDPKDPRSWAHAPEAALKGYFSTVREYISFMESLNRISAFREFRRRIDAGQLTYGGSKRNEIDAVKDPVARAAKLSRELLVDYGNISEPGMQYRNGIYPFWSWLEGNAPRYLRLIKNAPFEGLKPGEMPDHSARLKVVSALAPKLAANAAAKGVSLAIRMAAFTAAVAVWNRLRYPEEADALEREGRQGIILGRKDDGSFAVYSAPGAFYDALDLADSGDVLSDVADVRAGKATVREKAVESAKAMPARLVGGSFPVARTAAETALGVKLNWASPLGKGDALEPSVSPVRSRAEHAAKGLGMEWLFTKVTGRPERDAVSQLTKIAGIRDIDPGEIAYYRTKDAVTKWQRETKGKERGLSTSSYPDRSNALFYYRTAVKMGDTRAAEKWKAEYFERGGTEDGLSSSIELSSPLADVKNEVDAFKATLSPGMLAEVERAEAWYEQKYGVTK